MLKLIYYLLLILMLGIVSIVGCYTLINSYSKPYLYSDITAMPDKRVGLVLGTSKYLISGYKNEFYYNRIQAAADLYKAGKVDYFIVSGDNRKHDYNEPKQMQKDLVTAGVPESRIQPDFAGFRTLDSVLRMEKIFGHNNYVIISQRFHNQRALFLARAHGQKPIAFNAADPVKISMKKVLMREVLARVKAVFDIITNKQAKFYGDKINFPAVN